MAPKSSGNGTAKVAAAPPTEREAAMLAEQMNALLNIDGHLHNVIANDVDMGIFSSPFIHPLYQVRVKLDAVRGKKARRLAAYARAARKNSKAKAA